MPAYSRPPGRLKKKKCLMAARPCQTRLVQKQNTMRRTLPLDCFGLSMTWLIPMILSSLEKYEIPSSVIFPGRCFSSIGRQSFCCGGHCYVTATDADKALRQKMATKRAAPGRCGATPSARIQKGLQMLYQ